MTGLRRLIAHQRWFAAWLVVAALAVRLLVPAGYMPAAPGSLTLMICPDQAKVAVATPIHAMDHASRDHHRGDHAPSDQPCPFAGLAMPSIADADLPPMVTPPVPTAAVPTRALADARAPPRPSYVRPPLRGPPSLV